MGSYKIGYGKPPTHNRFRKGTSGNPKGRPKRKPTPIAELIDDVVHAPIEYRKRGVTKTATRYEFSLMILTERAAGGDVSAAQALLKVWEQAERQGNGGLVLEIQDWLPDVPGQSAAEKSEVVRELSEAPRGESWLDDD